MPESVPDTTRQVLVEIQERFELSKKNMEDIQKGLIDAFSEGYAHEDKDVGMLPTYVTKLPDGTEKGEAWAIDLGGTNLRVCKVVLNGKDSKPELEAQKFLITDDLKEGTAADLFKYIVNCLYEFMDPKDLQDLQDPKSNIPPLGFTFSFPVKPTAINRGTLIKWTKEYKIEDAVNKDIGELLDDALKKRKLPIRCNALLNDTTGALVSHAYHTGGCSLGAIFGTGTNGALVDKAFKITKLYEPEKPPAGNMVVNTEWGGFDKKLSVLPVTPFDTKVDEDSEESNIGSQLFEKRISGKYLGEITRYILLHLIEKKMLFAGYTSSKLDDYKGFDTKFMSDIEMDTSEKMDKICKILTEELEVKMDGKNHIEHSDLEIVRWACQCVGIRAALLSGIAVAATISFTGAKLPASVGIDGTVFLHYPNFKKRLRESLDTLLGKDQVKIGIAEDGSGIGAGICALMAPPTLREAAGAPRNDGERGNHRLKSMYSTICILETK